MATKSTTATTHITVTLTKPHTHQGKPLAAGSQLIVSPAIAAWLHTNGVVDAVKDAAKTTTQESK